MLPNNIPLTLKLQNGAATYFMTMSNKATFNELAEKLSSVINLSGGFIKNLKPVPIEDIMNEIEIPKTSFDSSDEDDEDEGNTTATTDQGDGGIEIDLDSLKFAIYNSKKELVLIEDQQETFEKIKDYSQVLFAMKNDEFDIIEPELDRDE